MCEVLLLSIQEGTKNDIDKLVKGIKEKFAPQKIILFGSQAKNNPSSKSDIDLCVVIDVGNKEEIERAMNLYIYSEQGLDFEKSVDLILYTPDEWEDNVKDSATFASLIEKKGVKLYG